jgi:cob(I)alamin adenosyltransferase
LDEVLTGLKERPPTSHVILTGRDAPPELIAAADLVTEMKEVKHPYQAGISAQPGIDY